MASAVTPSTAPLGEDAHVPLRIPATRLRAKKPSPPDRRAGAYFAGLLAALVAAATPASARASDPVPRAADQHFIINPVADITLTGASAGLSVLLSLILSTGEIKPSPLTPGVKLLSIDRVAVTQTIDPHASTYSNVGLYVAAGFAALDPLLSGFRDGWDAALVDATMYAESIALTEAVTDITKISVRRPRPIDYIECGNTQSVACSNTDLQLSFFSGHAATVASVTGTATYLAFMRSPNTARPWLTLAAGTLLTGFVSYERVRAGAHFPTDVITGSLIGASIGVLVPHLHRHTSEAPRVWIGAAPTPEGTGGLVFASGTF